MAVAAAATVVAVAKRRRGRVKGCETHTHTHIHSRRDEHTRGRMDKRVVAVSDTHARPESKGKDGRRA